MPFSQYPITRGMMIKNLNLFEQLIAEAEQQAFSGWDFSYIADRWQMSPTSWDYAERVRALLPQVSSLLDLGTGGGEFLASLAPLPPDTCATEGYAPNIPIARKTLEPLGVEVKEIKSDNTIPFADHRFDLVIDRHESFAGTELFRTLKPGGTFLTQQVGGQDNIRLNELLQDEVDYEFWSWTPALVVPQLEAAGFQIVKLVEEFPETVVSDIGAVVYYLKAIPWQIADFTVEKYYNRLADLHNHIQDNGRLVIQSHRFFIEARK
jgi:SAM-dependent methyltransferase